MKTIGDREILSVEEVNALAREVLEAISFWVEGEVYDYKPRGGRGYYYYFSLKDGEFLLPVAVRPNVFEELPFELANGQKVLAKGKLSLFTKYGKFNFQPTVIQLAGEGQLAKELEALKAKLQAEGLLAEERKRPLPPFPQKIGVVTSIASDAWADFQRHSVAKFPVMELYVADAYVQGPRSVNSLLRAIAFMQQQPIDVLVITRGGGSLEDLSSFNDERVARAIAASQIPTMVGVGHEKDVSIADLVADVRASTPTNAGQILTKPYEQAVVELQHQADRVAQLVTRQVEQHFGQLDYLASGLGRTRQKYQTLPLHLNQLAIQLNHRRHTLVDSQLVAVAALHEKLGLSAHYLISHTTQHLDSTFRQLQAVSPETVLKRGFSVVQIQHKIIRSVNQVHQGDTMNIRLAKGSLRGLVTRIEDEEEKRE